MHEDSRAHRAVRGPLPEVPRDRRRSWPAAARAIDGSSPGGSWLLAASSGRRGRWRDAPAPVEEGRSTARRLRSGRGRSPSRRDHHPSGTGSRGGLASVAGADASRLAVLITMVWRSRRTVRSSTRSRSAMASSTNRCARCTARRRHVNADAVGAEIVITARATTLHSATSLARASLLPPSRGASRPDVATPGAARSRRSCIATSGWRRRRRARRARD